MSLGEKRLRCSKSDPSYSAQPVLDLVSKMQAAGFGVVVAAQVEL